MAAQSEGVGKRPTLGTPYPVDRPVLVEERIESAGVATGNHVAAEPSDERRVQPQWWHRGSPLVVHRAQPSQGGGETAQTDADRR